MVSAWSRVRVRARVRVRVRVRVGVRVWVSSPSRRSMKTTQNLAVRAEMAVASGATSLNGPLSGITMIAPPAWMPMRVRVTWG